MTAKPPSPKPQQPGCASFLLMAVLLVAAIVLIYLVAAGDGFGIKDILPAPAIERAEQALPGGDGAGPAADHGKPNNCSKNCDDDN